MKIQTLPYLTWSAITLHGNRKKAGRFSIFVDTLKNKVYPVLINYEHAQVAPFILGVSADQLHEEPSLGATLIPVHLDLDYTETVSEIVTGICGFEDIYGIRHRLEDLIIAQERSVQFVKEGEVGYKDPLTLTLRKDYVNKEKIY